MGFYPMGKPKPGYPKVKVGDILTDQQMDRVMDILQKNGGDMDANIRDLKVYFNTIKGDLDKKGAVPDYLAYAVGYNLSKKYGQE